MTNTAIATRRPDSMGIMRRVAKHMALDSQNQLLHAELGSGKGWIGVQDFSRLRDEEIWMKVLRDPVWAKAIMLRMHLVAGTDWYWEATSSESRALIPYYDHLTEMIPQFPQCLMALSQAVFEGRSALRMTSQSFEGQLGDDDRERLWWYPKLYHIGAHQIRDEYNTEDEVLESGESITRNHYYTTTFDAVRGEWLRVENKDWYIFLNYGIEQGKIGQNRALLESLYFYWHAKTHVLKQLLQGVERFGYPWIHVKTNPDGLFGADEGLTNYASPKEAAEQLIATIKKMRQSQILVTDKESDVTAVDFNGESARGLIAIIDYIDKAGVELILASSMPTGGGQQGSFARAAVEAGSTSSLIRYDRVIVEDAMKQLSWALRMYNRGNWDKIYNERLKKFLWNIRLPKWRIGREERDDIKLNIERVRLMMETKQKMLRKEFYAAVQFTTPDEDDDVIDFAEMEAILDQQGLPVAGGVPDDALLRDGTDTGGAGDPMADPMVMAETNALHDSLQKLNPARYLNDHRESLRVAV